MKSLISLLLVFFFLSNTATAADSLYRWVDKNGNVSYSSRARAPKGAERISIAPSEKSTQKEDKTETVPSVEKDKTSAPKVEKKETKYKSLSIVSPQKDQAIRVNSGLIKINIALRPALDKKSGHEIVYSLDGFKKRSKSTLMIFPNISRGQHTIQVHVENNKGKRLIKSHAIKFQLHRRSVLFKK